ncbi:hypothetical protein TSUD_214930 [Trifolium subterraneum]|uniref:RNase H type-1 domain-containing protein n=1 Tax=Trifolium subterraneum TaxID=3900 RepID=A0A2Z6NMJ3_TRISU|nr:hypothetical protein TSUD_214930 [Trifolium subterraneum]
MDLQQCVVTHALGVKVMPIEERSIFFMEEHQEWIRTTLNKCRKQQNGSAWCDFLATVCHGLWMWRNKEKHDDDFVIRDYVKLNVDGARKHLNIVGCGGLICGSQGEWLGGFAKGVGDCSAFVAEFHGSSCYNKGHSAEPCRSYVGKAYLEVDGLGPGS